MQVWIHFQSTRQARRWLLEAPLEQAFYYQARWYSASSGIVRRVGDSPIYTARTSRGTLSPASERLSNYDNDRLTFIRKYPTNLSYKHKEEGDGEVKNCPLSATETNENPEYLNSVSIHGHVEGKQGNRRVSHSHAASENLQSQHDRSAGLDTEIGRKGYRLGANINLVMEEGSKEAVPDVLSSNRPRSAQDDAQHKSSENRMNLSSRKPAKISSSNQNVQRSDLETSRFNFEDIRPSDFLPRPPIIRDGVRRGRPLRILPQSLRTGHNFAEPPQYGFVDSDQLVTKRTAKYSTHKPSNDVYHLGRNRTLKDNLRQAPFSTLFHHNPYAHALAAPVREDCCTGAHLPNTCLLSFHIAENSTSSEGLSLLPLSLAAELIPKNKNITKLTSDEAALLKAREGDMFYRPEGAASYVSATEAALQFITQNPRKRVAPMAIGRRTHLEMTPQMFKSLHWRDDMPIFVLDVLRKILMKKLRWLFQVKQNKDKSGMLFEIPRGIDGIDLTRVNDLDDPSCVLQLTMPLESKTQSTTAGHDDSASSLEKENTASSLSREQTNLEAGKRIHDGLPLSRNTLRNLQSKSEKRQSGWWTSDVKRSLYSNTKPLPPPFRPLLTKYPTLLFRNRTIPIYNLPQLLGDERTAALIKGTVFEKSTYVALTAHAATVESQVCLLRLQIYLAGDRSYKSMRRERKWTNEWVGEAEEEEIGYNGELEIIKNNE